MRIISILEDMIKTPEKRNKILAYGFCVIIGMSIMSVVWGLNSMTVMNNTMTPESYTVDVVNIRAVEDSLNIEGNYKALLTVLINCHQSGTLTVDGSVSLTNITLIVVGVDSNYYFRQSDYQFSIDLLLGTGIYAMYMFFEQSPAGFSLSLS